jgi:fatty acid desaturase
MGAVVASNQPEADEIASDIPLARLDRTSAIKAARELSPADNLRSAITLTAQYALILSAAALAIKSRDWLVYGIAGLFIGTRVQVLAIMFHEATHYLMFSKRWVNDLVSDLFIAFPMGLSTHLYRSSHFQHHRKTNTFEDPDFVFMVKDRDQHFPKAPADFILLLVRSAFCVNFLPMLRHARRYSPAVNLFKAPPHTLPLHARVAYVAWMVLAFNILYWNQLFLDVSLWRAGVFLGQFRQPRAIDGGAWRRRVDKRAQRDTNCHPVMVRSADRRSARGKLSSRASHLSVRARPQAGGTSSSLDEN